MIPPAIIPYIFLQLSYKELLQCSLVCKLWYELTFDPLLAKKWEDINFQQKIQKLTHRYVKDSVTVTTRLNKEEKMDWKGIFEKVLKRGKNRIHYLKIWSSFTLQQLPMIANPNFLNNLVLLDLRNTNFDVKYLFKPEINNNIMKYSKEKQIEDIKMIENKIKLLTINNDDSINNRSGINNNDIEKRENNDNTNNYYYFLDLFKNLKYLYIFGCKNATKETVYKINMKWKHLTLDVKICEECHELTRICREKALNSDIHNIEKITHCSRCKKSHCDHCRPLWTCEVCKGDYTCQDCRAHGLTCTTCDSDYCYTCNYPGKVLECRYCHFMSCGQSLKCQNIGHLYKGCDKCDLYVCHKCEKDQKKLIKCSGNNCSKNFCKTCIYESSNSSLISFDKKDVEKRIYDNNYGICSYCNKLYCIDCKDNLSLYAGGKDSSYTVVICKECESFYKTQLLNLFRISPLRTSNFSNNTSSNSDRIYNHSSSSSAYSNNLLTMTSTNMLTNRSLSLESPISSYHDDNYIR
ncbi:hypothetical protein U3516DRAFT_895404 [Neocallimastix sp. 'constans']|jgi:hypothetical protein